MESFRAGFARVDITPQLGIDLVGYFERRFADGVLDPLLATAVAVQGNGKTAVIMSVDIIGIGRSFADKFRNSIAEKIGTDTEAVFIACTHTHLGPAAAESHAKAIDNKYIEWLEKRLCDAAVLAVADLKPAEMRIAKGRVSDIAFIRRFRMKGGNVRTNPGFQNPDIDAPIGTPDEDVSLVLFKREGAKEIALVNFQVHPDVIGGCKISADFPKFVRDTFETVIDNSLCMYINGAQGDTNHIDVRLGENQLRRGYERSRHMGRAIAAAAIQVYGVAEPADASNVRFVQENIFVDHNKGTAEELPEARRIKALHDEGRDDEISTVRDMSRTTTIAKACRIVNLSDMPDKKELPITALAIGDVAIACFPGEPFTDIGREVKNVSPFKMTLAACCANGYEGYYPMQSAYDEGGYEASTARYRAGTAEKIIETSSALLATLYKK